MKDRALLPYKAVTILLLILFLIIFATQDFLIALVENLPACPFYTRLHLYCPACGNTRSVRALFHGDLISAARYNICPIIFCFFILLSYVELATYSFGRQIRLLPRKLRYYLIIIAIMLLYVGIRNFIPGMTP